MTKHQRRTVHGGAGILACALGLAAAGCGGGGGSSTQTQTGAQASTPLADHLTLSLSEDKTSAAVGDKVTYQITLSNPTAAPITSTYRGYPGTGPVTLDMLLNPYDIGNFRVQDAAGELIAHDGTLSGFPPTPAAQLVSITLQPAQSLSATEVYTLIRTGVYTSAAALRNSDLSATPVAGPLTVTVH